MERMPLFLGLTVGMEHDVTEDFPGASEVDHYCTVRDGDCTWILPEAGGMSIPVWAIDVKEIVLARQEAKGNLNSLMRFSYRFGIRKPCSRSARPRVTTRSFVSNKRAAPCKAENTSWSSVAVANLV